jgi:5-methylcytosine-specific restriction enzyme A
MNRAKAIEVHGTTCKACGFDFNAVYGADLACSYIEIHHVRSITTIVGPADPRPDLIPLCSNYHSMARRNLGQITTVDELRARLQD